MRRKLSTAACAAVFIGLSAAPALAGEVVGPPGNPDAGAGHPTAAVTNANSICAYSGLNDFNQGPTGAITQTPGNQGPPGAPGHGTCAGGTNPNRQ